MNLKDIEIIESLDQNFYDSFNKFIISSDLKVFGKLLARFQLFEMIKDVPGDIVECGVFKGTGIFTFLKLKRYYFPNSLKKVIGFDFFDTGWYWDTKHKCHISKHNLLLEKIWFYKKINEGVIDRLN